MSGRPSHLDRILGRLEDLDTTNLTVLVQRLARERRLLETVFHTIREGILVLGRNGVIQYANAAAHRLIGLRDEDIGKATLFKLMPDLARTFQANLLSLASVEEAAVVMRELELTYPEARHVRLYLTPLSMPREADGPRQYAVIITDITEQKTSTQEMLEDERLSSIFMLAAGVAHEIGNPLNSINIHLQLMKRQLKRLGQEESIQKVTESVEVCRMEVERLDGILRHFLQAIRPQPPDLADVRLMELLEEVLQFQSREMENLGIRVEIHLDGEIPVVLADRNQVRQVFFNVIKNAMQAMTREGVLRVTARADDEDVYLYLADNGVGIDSEEISRVFQPYFTTKKQGHGLGMMVCQRIMRDHGGKIGIDSVKGSGTVVTLQFPQKHRRTRLLGDGSESVL